MKSFFKLVELKERVKSLEIQSQRLCEVFKKKTHDFREAMYMMFGYRIDALSGNQYRLRNQYAFDSDDILLFQVGIVIQQLLFKINTEHFERVLMNEVWRVYFQISQSDNSTMELLETPFSQTLSELIDLHLKQHQSIPVFLASITVDLFNKQTISSFSTMDSTLCAD